MFTVAGVLGRRPNGGLFFLQFSRCFDSTRILMLCSVLNEMGTVRVRTPGQAEDGASICRLTEMSR